MTGRKMLRFFTILPAVLFCFSRSGETAESPAQAAAAPVSLWTENAAPPDTVQLGGDVFGIQMYADGVIVSALEALVTNGVSCCPAKDAGILPGDYILAADGTPVQSNRTLSTLLNQNRTVRLTLRRGAKQWETSVTPVLCGSCYKTGMWIRDSAAGIGTVTCYSADGTRFAALGHGICDADTRQLLQMRSGQPAPVIISGILPSVRGAPGKLRGYFSGTGELGTLTENRRTGLLGTMHLPHRGTSVPLGNAQSVHTGAVTVYSTIDETGVQSFSAEIVQVDRNTSHPEKSMVIRITDPLLLEKTGGIVQGMSGSPLVQDGRLVGALTHVFVNDPTKGYAIFIENMLKTAP